MHSLIKTFVFLLFFAALTGCVEMRDYTGVRDGAFGLNVKQGFGKGSDHKKDYYLVEDGKAVILGDTKNEVIALIGTPDNIKTTLEGYESWLYGEMGLELLFENDKVVEWREF